MRGEAAILAFASSGEVPMEARFYWSLLGRVVVCDLGKPFFIFLVPLSEKIGEYLPFGNAPSRDYLFVVGCPILGRRFILLLLVARRD